MGLEAEMWAWRLGEGGGTKKKEEEEEEEEKMRNDLRDGTGDRDGGGVRDWDQGWL